MVESFSRPASSTASFIVFLAIIFLGAGTAQAVASSCGDSTEVDATPPVANQSVTTIAEGGVWTWFNDERAVFVDSTLYVGYVNSCGQSSVTAYPLGSSGRLRTVLSSFREVDDHDNPALLPLADGRLLATYSQHSTETHWYWRTKQEGSFQWSPERATEPLGTDVTYTNLFQLSAEGGRIYNFFRGFNFDPTLMISEDGAETWSEPRHFIESGGGRTRPYVKYVSNEEDRIDLLYTQAHPRKQENDVYHLYYREGVLRKSDGTEICALDADDCLPVPVDAGTRVYDADEAGRAWVWDIEYAAEGVPVGVYITARDSTVGKDLRYRYARFNEGTGQWEGREIAYAGTRLYQGENHYAGGISIDPSHPDTVYASADVDPETGDDTETGRYQLYRGTRGEEGQPWNWTQLTQSAEADNLRPFVPRSGEGHRAVLWFRGEYSSYQEYDTDIVGIIDE